MWCERANRQRHGWHIAWHANGRRKEAGRYVDGRREGTWTRFWDFGGRRAQVNFEAGEEHGELVLWNELGEKEREIRYQHGEPTS